MPLTSTELGDLVRYSAWASKKLLDFASGLPEELTTKRIENSHGGILKTFQHIYYADRIWLARVERTAPYVPEDPPPGPGLADLNRAWWPLLDRMTAGAESAGDGEQAIVKWQRNGEQALAIDKLILHVVNHATYHRGQIASMLRQNGYVPPSTDFVLYLRSLK